MVKLYNKDMQAYGDPSAREWLVQTAKKIVLRAFRQSLLVQPEAGIALFLRLRGLLQCFLTNRH